MDTSDTSNNVDEIRRRAASLEAEYGVRLPQLSIGGGAGKILVLSFKYDAPVLINTPDFFLYTDELASLKVVDDSTVRTARIRQTAIDYTNGGYDEIHFHDSFVGENFTVSVVKHPVLIGCVNNKDEWTKGARGGPCSSVNAIEFRYNSVDDVLSPEQEDDIIQGVLFTISDKYNRPFAVGLRDVRKYIYRIELKLPSEKFRFVDNNVASLPHYSPMFDFYTQALQVKNDDIKFLYFYKVIEYISPIVAKVKVHEELCRKLASGIPATGNVGYLDSIFSLTRTHDKSIKDSELAKTVMEQCDIVKLYEFLPGWVRKRCPKETRARKQQHAIGMTAEKERAIKNKVAAILYATRNSIVHAKANYEPTGDECPQEDLFQLNIFMRKLCKDLIFWKDKHPEITLK